MRSVTFVIALLCPLTALAGGYADWVEVPLEWPVPPPPNPEPWYYYIAEGHAHFDLLTVVDDGDCWNSAYANAYLEGEAADAYSFWDHPNGSAYPVPAAFPYFGLMAYDSFWTSPVEFPNPDLDAAHLATLFSPGSPIQDSATAKEAEWYVDPSAPYVDGGTWHVARYNIRGLCPDGYSSDETPFGPAAELVIDGNFVFGSGENDDPFQLRIPLCWYVPEPSGLVLLGVGYLLIRRRR